MCQSRGDSHLCAGHRVGPLAQPPKRRTGLQKLSCDIHTQTPAKKSSTNFLLYPFLLRKCSTNRIGHGHGYECHSPETACSKTVRWRKAAFRRELMTFLVAAPRGWRPPWRCRTSPCGRAPYVNNIYDDNNDNDNNNDNNRTLNCRKAVRGTLSAAPETENSMVCHTWL